MTPLNPPSEHPHTVFDFNLGKIHKYCEKFTMNIPFLITVKLPIFPEAMHIAAIEETHPKGFKGPDMKKASIRRGPVMYFHTPDANSRSCTLQLNSNFFKKE